MEKKKEGAGRKFSFSSFTSTVLESEGVIFLYQGDYLGEHLVPSEKTKKLFWLMEGGRICFSSISQPLVDIGLIARSVSEGKKTAKRWAQEN